MVRWLITALLIFASIPLFLISLYFAALLVWHSTHELTKAEAYRIELAQKYIDGYSRINGHLPSIDEFQSWAISTPPELSFEGIGFTYTPSKTPENISYELSFLGNDCWVSWSQKYADKNIVEIDPSCNSITNSKIIDLAIFLLPAIFLVFMAILAAPKEHKQNAL